MRDAGDSEALMTPHRRGMDTGAAGSTARGRHGFIRPHTSKLSILHRVFDMIIVATALFASCMLLGEPWHDNHTLIAVAAAALFSTCGGFTGVYRSWRITPILGELTRIWGAWITTAVAVVIVGFSLRAPSILDRDLVVTWFVVAPISLSLWRVGWRGVLRKLRKHGYNSRSVAIVGANTLGLRLAKRINSASWMGLRWHGFFDDRSRRGQGRAPDQVEPLVRGNVDRLIEEAKAGRVDMVYITLPLRAETRVAEIIDRLSDTTVSVYVVPDFLVFDLLHGRSYTLGDIPVVSVFETPFYGPEGWVKEVEDFVLGTLILALVAIPMLLIAIGIKATSPGPVLFKQRRFGINGQDIEVWKFRTMNVSENGVEVVQARKDDPRVTPLGRFLRRTSLDELPQFFNVLQGRMSIVGPRPHAIAHNEQYRRIVRRYMLRHKVKPGITGWAQVNGWRGETETLDKMESRVEYDLEYIRRWSLLFDLKIIALTLWTVIRHDNAY